MKNMNQMIFDNNTNDTRLCIMGKLPARERQFVTINEMAKLLGIGDKTIRRFCRDNPNSEYIYMVGNRVYLKREMFAKQLLTQRSL